MTAKLEGRIARLEQAAQGDTEGLLAEHELSAEGRALLEESLAGLGTSLEQGRIVPGPATLSEEGRALLEAVLTGLRTGGP